MRQASALRPFLAFLLLSSLLAPALAAPEATLQGARADHVGVQQVEGALAGFQVRAASDLPATFVLQGQGVTLRTENATQRSVGPSAVAVAPDRGGTERSWASAELRSETSRAGLDVVIVPLAGHPPPTVTAASRSLGLERSDRGELVEAGYVNASRPRLRADVGGSALGTSSAVDEAVVTGAFAVSVWSWDFTAWDGQRNETFRTGVHSSDVVSDPVTGQTVTSTDFDQVAQIQVANGTLRLQGLPAASVAVYSASFDVRSVGHFVLRDAVGLLDAPGAGELAGRDLSGDGTLSSGTEAADGGVRMRLRAFEGAMAVDGQAVHLGGDGPLREAGAGGGGLVAPASAWSIGVGASLLAIVLVILLVKGPARRARFNGIEGRFDAKDYRGVLERIEPFTAWRRYRRRAAVLKAVSLLSLEQFREASLYLETLEPATGPDAATTAFLKAFAAAGLHQDDVVIHQLTECFRLDPSYIREARFVPMLAGYLPYFSLSPEFA